MINSNNNFSFWLFCFCFFDFLRFMTSVAWRCWSTGYGYYDKSVKKSRRSMCQSYNTNFLLFFQFLFFLGFLCKNNFENNLNQFIFWSLSFIFFIFIFYWVSYADGRTLWTSREYNQMKDDKRLFLFIGFQGRHISQFWFSCLL